LMPTVPFEIMFDIASENTEEADSTPSSWQWNQRYLILLARPLLSKQSHLLLLIYLHNVTFKLRVDDTNQLYFSALP
jgi:hypothetical protein